MNWAVHNVYRFNKDGKINLLLQYYDDDIFNEINNSSRTIENGIVYINHPYIVTVRKLANAYCEENIDAMLELYAPDAMFTKSNFKTGEYYGLEAKKKEFKETFAYFDNITLTQVGYPDCLYYEKNDSYVVYSWWSLSCVTKEGKKFSKIPVMMANTFNKEGKIITEEVYSSTNHFQ